MDLEEEDLVDAVGSVVTDVVDLEVDGVDLLGLKPVVVVVEVSGSGNSTDNLDLIKGNLGFNIASLRIC